MCVRGEKSTPRSSLSSLLWQAQPIRNHLLSPLHPWQATSISLLDTVKGCSVIWCRRLRLLISVRENWCGASGWIQPIPELWADVLGYAEHRIKSRLLLMRSFPSFCSVPWSEWIFISANERYCSYKKHECMSLGEQDGTRNHFCHLLGHLFTSLYKSQCQVSSAEINFIVLK